MSVRMTFEYTGGFNCRIEHGPSGAQTSTDAPKDNAGKGEAFSPTDMVGAALATCAVTTMAIKAPKQGIEFGTARGEVVKEMTAEAPRRIRRLTVDIHMPEGLDSEARAKLEVIGRECPVALSLAPEVDLVMNFHYSA